MNIWKITDSDCPVCKEMTEFDSKLIESMGYGLVLVDFDSVPHHQDLVDYIRSEIVDDKGAVDIPMYIVQTEGKFVGAVTGRNTKGELKRKLMQATPHP
jgi:glutaredoxin